MFMKNMNITIMKKYLILLIVLMSLCVLIGQEKPKKNYRKSLANYNDFKMLVEEVDDYRKQRLIDLNTFIAVSKEAHTIILDTRSEFRYTKKHIKGAIHLNFSDFTQENLQKLIPNLKTKILIYCNNNFYGDQIHFTSKIVKSKLIKPRITTEKKVGKFLVSEHKKPITLALNIPTFINLYGYGYKNVYELDELVYVNDKRIEFEGTDIK